MIRPLIIQIMSIKRLPMAWATEIKLRAERKAGQILKPMPKNTGAKGIGKSVLPQGKGTPILADMGITYKQSAAWQQIAEIPETEFEAFRGKRKGF